MPRRLDLGELAETLALTIQRQEGLVRRRQLRAYGVERTHVAARIRSGRWQLVAPEVVSTDNGRLDAEQLRWRAVLHAPDDAWVDGLTALVDLGLSGWATTGVHILLGRSRRPRPLDGVVVHQSDRLPVEHDLSAGLPRVPAARAALNAASRTPHPRIAAGLVIASIQQRVTTAADVAAEVELAGRVRHKLAIQAAVADRLEGADSVAEVDILALIRRAGLPAPRRQVVIAGRPRDLVVDLPDGRVLVIEVDGPQHDDPRARWVDAQRDAELVALGYVVLRFPAYVIRTDPASVVSRLRQIREASERRQP